METTRWGDGVSRPDTVSCALCDLEPADPIGVGGDFSGRATANAYLIMRCRRCGTVTVNWPPGGGECGETAEREPILPDVPTRQLRRWCHHLPADARILALDGGDRGELRAIRRFAPVGWHIDGMGSRRAAATDEAGYDLVLLCGALEHAENPLALLVAVRSLLRADGRAVVVTPNTGSATFGRFGGRHWSMYSGTGSHTLFSAAALRHFAAAAGLRLSETFTLPAPRCWVTSLRNVAVDWNGPRWLVQGLSGRATVATIAGTLVEGLHQLRGRGTVLVGVLRPSGGC